MGEGKIVQGTCPSRNLTGKWFVSVAEGQVHDKDLLAAVCTHSQDSFYNYVDDQSAFVEGLVTKRWGIHHGPEIHAATNGGWWVIQVTVQNERSHCRAVNAFSDCARFKIVWIVDNEPISQKRVGLHWNGIKDSGDRFWICRQRSSYFCLKAVFRLNGRSYSLWHD